MCKTSHRLTILVLGLLGGSCCRVIPATHPPYTIIGTVESVDSRGLYLRHKTGQQIRIAITPQTTIVRRNHPAEVADIKVGMRIVVLYHVVDGALTADEVRLFRAPSEPATDGGWLSVVSSKLHMQPEHLHEDRPAVPIVARMVDVLEATRRRQPAPEMRGVVRFDDILTTVRERPVAEQESLAAKGEVLAVRLRQTI
jgi:hypothetical protein